MKQTTYVLCNNEQQVGNVLDVIIGSNVGVDAVVSDSFEDGRRLIEVHYETGVSLILLGILLGRKTSLYND